MCSHETGGIGVDWGGDHGGSAEPRTSTLLKKMLPQLTMPLHRVLWCLEQPARENPYRNVIKPKGKTWNNTWNGKEKKREKNLVLMLNRLGGKCGKQPHEPLRIALFPGVHMPPLTWPPSLPHNGGIEILHALCVTISFHGRGQSALGIHPTKYACTRAPGLHQHPNYNTTLGRADRNCNWPVLDKSPLYGFCGGTNKSVRDALSSMVATNHLCLLSPWNVASLGPEVL